MSETALLFDLDGTLTDSDPFHLAAFAEIGAQWGVELDDEIFRTHVSGQSNRRICETLFPHVDPALWDDLADIKEARFREMVVGRIRPIAGLEAFIEREKRLGSKFAVVSNAPRANVETVVSAIGLDGVFDTLVLGSELPRSKPDPLPYLTALEKLGVDGAHAIAFEDAVPGLLAAVRSGVATVGLETSLDAAAIAETGAHLAIPDYDDPALLGFVDRRLGRA